jgi:UDP-N-acetylglucosamine--N-acetylmuramyl-(pentapeptide) pyrophosphoryl-undecaprenol N-acetylglucosamine transferase
MSGLDELVDAIKKLGRPLIAASGGGHTGYAVALAQRLVEHGVEPHFVVPEGDNRSRAKVERYGVVVAETPKFMGPEDPLWKGLARALPALLKTLKRLPNSYQVAVSTGSNHSIAVAIAAWLKGARIVNLESSVRFTRPSRAFRMLRRIAWINAVQWPEQKAFAPNALVVGPLYEKPRYPPRDEGYILVATGTYGYRELLDAIAEANPSCRIVAQTGRVNPEPYRKLGWIAFQYDPDIDRWIAGATLVVTHVGKTALDAALAYRKKVIIVYNPRWTKHGATLEDAKTYAQKIGAILVGDPNEAVNKIIKAARCNT